MKTRLFRSSVLRFLSAAALAVVLSQALGLPGGIAQAADAAKPVVQVYKTPTCGCCGKWVEHLEANGFRTEVTNLKDVTPVKLKQGVKPELSSCHTAIVAGYVVEGHVPAADVRKMLKERPDILGLAVPQMPLGSPGMEGAQSEPYDTLAIKKDGTTEVYARHGR